MFKRILVANRGEIACRIIKTAKKLGIQTVAVYSDADKDALHVKMADHSINIGLSAANESYLSIEKIVKAVKETKSDAVHPGYGFLSENPKFALALKSIGVTFIGPPVQAIEAMGDKITSKNLAKEAGVNIVPGHLGLIKDYKEAIKISNQIGYPVMIKASAGGGGKGMRIVWADSEVKESFEASRNEAQSSFGDDRIFVEKFIVEPRHIEIQILADSYENYVSLGERECSIQRRNQKVIEEAPSSFLDKSTRVRMGDQACQLARSVGYQSAGTIEFIVDKDKNFFFLEMNTRLQVEHPVTELVTGIDLVEEMINIAYGKKISVSQEEVQSNGWAIESRIYAEDPYRNFLPSIGRLARYKPPQEVSHPEKIIRNDTGVEEGGAISIYYDPMIAKLCVWGENRAKAIKYMTDALERFELEGVGHNIPFLSAVLNHSRFNVGDINTAFIEEEYPHGFKGATLNLYDQRLISSAIIMVHINNEMRRSKISGRVVECEVSTTQDWLVLVEETKFSLGLEIKDKELLIRYEDQEVHSLTSDWRPGKSVMNFTINLEQYALKVTNIPGGYRVRFKGADLTVYVKTKRQAQLLALMIKKEKNDDTKSLVCPMPGLIVSLDVTEGDKIEEGQSLCTIEAMKMENILRSERKGIVKLINKSVGDSIAVNDIIMEFV